MKKEKIFEIGKKLGISESETKAAFLTYRSKIVTVLIIGIASVLMNRIWFEPLHYTVTSIMDFDFFTRFL